MELWLSSHAMPPKSITLDIDDTVDVVHGHQQLSLFNGHHDERCFLPIHIYEAGTGRPVAMILRPGKAPRGKEIRGHLRRLVRRIRCRWPTTRILIRGDSHYGRAEVTRVCASSFCGASPCGVLVVCGRLATHIRAATALFPDSAGGVATEFSVGALERRSSRPG